MKKIAVLLSLFVSLTALAQTPQRPITADDRRQLGAILPHLLDNLYVLPDKGKELAQQLRAAFASGRYDSATTAGALAEAINRDLLAANDRHLNMRLDPRTASEPVLTVAAWEERHSAMRQRGPGGPAGPSRPYDPEQIRRTNYGVAAAEVLPGNVGYLRITEFVATEEARAAISAAMALLAHTDAMIVDVSDCPGGNGDTVSYLASYFFGPGKKVLMNRFHRPSGRSSESTTVDVPGRRMPQNDLYVLTGRTGSACESFAFTLQQWGRAKTVGERSGGAGYNNMLVDVGRGLVFSISIGTATHPKSGKGWEAVGVQPDIPAAASKARDVAHAEALRGLVEKATTDEQRRALQNALQRVSATPPAATAAEASAPAVRMEDYVGTYGVREVSIRDGELWFQRTGARGGPLKPIGVDRFDLNGDVIVSFERGDDRAVRALQIEFKDGRTERVAKE